MLIIGRGRLAIAEHETAAAIDQLKTAIDLLGILALNKPYEQSQAYELMGQVLASNPQFEDALSYYHLALQQFRRIEFERPAERLAARIWDLGAHHEWAYESHASRAPPASLLSQKPHPAG